MEEQFTQNIINELEDGLKVVLIEDKGHNQFDNINSQTVEQANSLLKRLKSSLSYMNAKHFLAHIKPEGGGTVRK